MILELEEPNFAGFIDDGTVYPAKVRDVRLTTRNYNDRVTGEPKETKRITFRFELVADDDHDGTDLYGETSTKFVSHVDCRIYSWAQAILGMHLPPKYRLDTDDLVDRDCRV